MSEIQQFILGSGLVGWIILGLSGLGLLLGLSALVFKGRSDFPLRAKLLPTFSGLVFALGILGSALGMYMAFKVTAQSPSPPSPAALADAYRQALTTAIMGTISAAVHLLLFAGCQCRYHRKDERKSRFSSSRY